MFSCLFSEFNTFIQKDFTYIRITKKIRMMRLTRVQEDYLEVISDLIDKAGYARVTDISTRLDLNPSSVHSMVRTLQEKGLVRHQKSAPVTLTKKGRDIARTVKHKHETFVKFLEFIKVPKHIAQQDAMKIEHNMSPITIEKLKNFVEYCDSCPYFKSRSCKFELNTKKK